MGVRAFGKSLPEVYANCAYGMFSILASHHEIRESERVQVEAEAEDPEQLLVAWLSELLYKHESEKLILCRFSVKELGKGRIKGEAWGEKIDPERHHLGREIKAVTYHELSLREAEGNWIAEVILDV